MKKQTRVLLALAILFSPVSAFAASDAVTPENSTTEVAQPTEEKEAVRASEEVIFNAETIDAFEDKENYLLMKADEFFAQKQYEDAKNIATYVLSKLNADSQDAQELLSKAEEKLDSMIEINPVEITY